MSLSMSHRFSAQGAQGPYALQYLVLRFPEKWELTWGGLRRKPQLSRKEKKFAALKARVERAYSELVACGLVAPLPKPRNRELALYDDVPEEAN